MKILWFTNTPCEASEKLTGEKITSGGWLYSLSTELKKLDGVQLFIAFNWGFKIDSFEYNGINYIPILYRGEDKPYKRALNRFTFIRNKGVPNDVMQRAISVVRDVNPDIVHVHGSEEYFGLVSKYIDNQKFVLSIQGLMSPYFEKYYSGLKKEDLKRFDSIIKFLRCRNTAQEEITFRIKADREREIFKYINNIIGRTFWDRQCSLALNPHRKYFEVGEILRKEFYGVNDRPAYTSKTVLVSTVSSGIYKGLETIYNTAAIMNKCGFDFEWRVIGVAENDEYNKIVKVSTKLQASDNSIILMGRKSAKEMVPIMTESSCFVQVSHIENSPNSLCEAMLLGLPIVATYAGGTASLIKASEEGLLIQDGDPYVMAGAIMELMSNKENAIRMAKNARRTACDRHNPQKIVKALLDTYIHIINEKDS